MALTTSSVEPVIRAVFFDYDGVLTRDSTGSLTTCRYLSEHTGLPYERVQRAFLPHNKALNLGKTTHAQVWPSVCRALGQAIPLSLLIGAFESTPLNPPMFELALSLRVGCATGIITDNKKDRIDHLKKYQGLDTIFAPIVVSAETGCTKGDAAIFKYALELSRVDPEESIFIDNSRDNLVAAAALGMNVIYFDNAKNDVAGLVRHLREGYGMSVVPSEA